MSAVVFAEGQSGAIVFSGDAVRIDDATAAAANAAADRAEDAAASINTRQVVDTTALAAIDETQWAWAVTGNGTEYLFDASDLSAEITAGDPSYVAPDSDPTGASGAWVRQGRSNQDEWYVEEFGQPGADNLPQFQAAYDAASAVGGGTVVVTGGPWTCSAPITLSGELRCAYRIEGSASFATSTDLANAVPELANATGHLWEEVNSKTVFLNGSGGRWLYSGELHGTGADAAGQRDLIRVEMEAHATNTGPSWDGVGVSNVNRDQTAISAFAFCAPGLLYTSLWGGNFYAYFPATSNGQGTGIEANIDLDVGVPAVKELGTFNKLGVSSVSKDQPATAAFAVGGQFYKGVILRQSNLPSDTASRAFEYTDLFEVMRDGRLMIGKGASNLFAAGCEFGPDGTFYVTGDNAPAQPFYARDDILSGAANIRAEQDRALSAAGNQRVFAQKVVSCQTATDGAENGQIEWQTIISGTLGSRMFLQQGLSIGGGAQLVRQFCATATLDFASIAANAVGTALTVTVTGALVGDHVTVTPPAAAAAQGVVYNGVVTSTNTVTIYPKNVTTGAIDPASGTFSVEVRGWV